MANQKEYKIIINGITESIEGIGTLQDSLDKLGRTVSESGGHFKAASSSMDELAKTEQKITQYNKEYQTALAANKAVLADNAKEIKNKLDLEKAEITVSENLRDTYAQKQQLLTAMGKVIKNTAGDTSELQKQYAELNQELKDFDASLGNHQRNVGDYAQATKNLKQELREYQLEMANMLDNGIDKADPKFVELAKKAGALKDAMADAGEEINRFASDTKKIDDVINIAQSATAAFELYKGTMSAFGFETEAAEEAIQKLAGAMSIIQSLQTLSNTLQNGSATARIFNGVMKITGAQLITNQIASIKATAAQNGLTTAQKAGAIASKTLGLALKAIPLMLVLSLVVELIGHWQEFVGWLKKTFPWLSGLKDILVTIKNVLVGFGKAVMNWVINPLKTFSNVMMHLLKGEFKEAIKAAADGVLNQFKGTAEAMDGAFKKPMKKIVDEVSEHTQKKALEDTQYNLKMLKAKYGDEARYSKEGIALQKKEFELRKKLAKGDAETLKELRLEEVSFDRECQEAKTKAAEEGSNRRTTIRKNEADKANKIAEEEAKKAEEEAKKAAEYKAKADEALYRSTVEYLIKQREEEIKYYEAEVKMYSAGPIEKYQAAVEKVNTATEELVKLQRQLHLYDFFNDYKQNIDASADSLDDFMASLNTLVEDFKAAGKVISVNEFSLLAKSLDQFKNLTEDQLKYLYHIYIDYLKDGSNKHEKFISDIRSVQAEQLKNEMEGIEKTTLKLELENDKKSEAAIKLTEELNKQWDNYLEHVKQVYGEDSKEYLEAQKKKRQATSKRLNNASPINKNESKTKGNDVNGGFGLDQTNLDALWDEDSPVYENLAKLGDLLFENVFDPIADGFSALLEFQIEEAQEALDKATEMHDKSVDQLEASQNKVQELNDKMKNSSGAQLEALKQQQADEMLLLAQREAEEKRLAREKEKREKELAKKQKQQRKLELQMELAESIVNTAVGFTKALTWGWPLGAVFAAIVGAMGAMQTAIIAKQISKLADGGLLQGRSHAQGGIAVGNTGIEVEGGEYVVNKRSTAKYLPLLQAINEEGARKKTVANQLGKYANGGQLNYQRISSNLDSVDTNKVIQNSIEQIDMHPQVSVVDINRGQKNLTQVRQMAGASR